MGKHQVVGAESPKDWGYVQIDKPDVRGRIWRGLVRAKAEVRAWNDELSTFISLGLESFEEGGLFVARSATAIAKNKSPAPGPNTRMYCSVHHERGIYFFKTKVIKVTGINVLFEMPKLFFGVQRRKYLRWIFTKDRRPKASAFSSLSPHREMRLSLFDISQGGVSLIVPTDELPFFAKGQSVHLRDILLRKWLVEAQGIVVSTVKDSQSNHRVGIEFNKIAPLVAANVNQYVIQSILEWKKKLGFR